MVKFAGAYDVIVGQFAEADDMLESYGVTGVHTWGYTAVTPACRIHIRATLVTLVQHSMAEPEVRRT